jgi:DNA-binding MarR family transcriptional regulator
MRVITSPLGPVVQHWFDPMDAYSTERDDLSYSDQPPVLIAASSDTALARALRSIECSGARVAATLSVANAMERIDRQVSASALWIELDEDGGRSMDELLTSVSRDVSHGRFAAVVSTSARFLDAVAAPLMDSPVEIIVDAGDAERAAALALAVSNVGAPVRLSDVAADRNAERLRQLSDEVSRIASTLARLSTGPGAAPPVVEKPLAIEAPEVSIETVRSIIRARRLRARFFQGELFADPAWDMLLDLLQAEISRLRVPVSSLCIAAAVPATTALRWLKTMVSQGIFVRRADPLDGRRVFVELAPEASRALRAYFAEVGPVAVI